jgi:hypothetical protein
VPSIAFGSSAYKRSELPELQLINMFIESAATSENQVALISRPGLATLSTKGAGPINGLYANKGVLEGSLFSISGGSLYRGSASIGTVVGSGVASFAGSDAELIVTRGSVARSYNGTNIQDIAFPDSASVLKVCFIGSLFVAIRAASQKYYWSDVLDGRTWDALNFASAEREPDQILDAEVLGDNLWLFGQSTIECHAHTGVADDPFTPIEQVLYSQGVMATGCVVQADNTLFFIGANRSVYRLGETPQRISDHSIEERILASTTARLLTFAWQGHEFICVRLDTETLVYDCATQGWCEFQTNGGQWIASHAAMVDKTAYFGHQSTGALLGFSGWTDQGVELERLFTAAMPLDAPVTVNRLSLWANSGRTGVLSGQGSAPQIEMRSSDDAGNTWTDWDGADLGVAGDYRAVPEWRALGQFGFPGAMFGFRVTDPVPVRISAVKVNDPGGGR